MPHTFFGTSDSPLGQVTFAGLNVDCAGLPRGKMRVYGSYCIVYALSGSAFYEDEMGTRANIEPGDLILIYPDVGHCYGPRRGRQWSQFYVIFEGPLFDVWRRQGIISPQRPIYHLEPIGHWRWRLEEIVAPHLPQLERVCRTQAFLGDMVNHGRRDAATAPDDRWLAQARALLEADIEQPLYIADAARRLRLSPETFRKKFVRLAGLSPYRYRTTRVIDHACRLVHEGRLATKQIAQRLGFTDEFHFSRRFKQITGRSPAQYRALLRPHQASA